MYVSSVLNFDTRLTVTLTFFPVPAYTKSFESVKDSITQQILKKKRDETGQRWIKQQLANAKSKTYSRIQSKFSSNVPRVGNPNSQASLPNAQARERIPTVHGGGFHAEGFVPAA
jgi:hypothetical protein